MPLPLVLGRIGMWGAKAAAGLAVGYACEKVVEKAAGKDNPLGYACYLIGGKAAVGGLSKAKGAVKLVVRQPFTKQLVTKAIFGKVIQGLVKLPFRGLGAMGKLIGGLTRGVLKNPLVQAGIFVALVGSTVNTFNFAVNFNINSTDDELLKQIEEKINNFYGLFGSAVGSSLGYLMCGALPGSIAFAFNPAVGALIMKDLDEDARGEVYAQAGNIGRLSFQTLVNAELTRQFMNARRYLKRDPNHPVSKILKNVMGKETFKKWGESNQPSFTISENVINKAIDNNIKDKGLKQFTEQLLENFTESCIESGFIIAQNLDSAIAANVLAQRQIIGKPVEVSIQLNTQTPKKRKK
jgi:hypothetical protein